jgi:transcriptional regulator with GAF, ATPase, and Fis domain
MKSVPIEIPSTEGNFEQTHPKSLFRLRESPKDFEPETPEHGWAAVARKVGCIGKSSRVTRTLEEAATLAGHSAPLLLIGETGSGKEVLSKFIHALSPRANGPLVTVNCAALPEGLAESLLFGHEKGSFTGALRRQKGKFELASGGTLFLDEIGELTLANQAKLLRVLEDKKVDALGSDAPISIDVRIIAATNRDLGQEVAKGNFREDLYYRLRAGEILIPPLRERIGDVPLIAIHILAQFNMSLASPKQFSAEALKFLETQPWPGNVRDLMNTIERAALLSPHAILEPGDFKTEGARPRPTPESAPSARMPMLYQGFSLEKYLSEMRQALIDQALRQSNGSQSEAARLLGLTPQAVSKHLKKNAPVMRRE